MSARAALIAAWTSRAAPSMLRDRSNCRVMRELPTVLDEVISVTPAIAPSRRSSGVVTLVATVSGEAPGSDGRDLDGRESRPWAAATPAGR